MESNLKYLGVRKAQSVQCLSSPRWHRITVPSDNVSKRTESAPAFAHTQYMRIFSISYVVVWTPLRLAAVAIIG